MKNGLIFDLDGTLWDTSQQITNSWNIVLKRHNLPSITLTQLCGCLGKTPDEVANSMFSQFPLAKRSILMNECFQEELHYLQTHGGNLYPNLYNTLENLSKSYALFIVSNCSHGYIDTFLDYHNLGRFFQDSEYAGRTGKGKADNIRLLIERNHLDKAAYIGDTQMDLDACLIAGIPFIHAAYGFGTVDKNVPVIHTFEELPIVTKFTFSKI